MAYGLWILLFQQQFEDQRVVACAVDDVVNKRGIYNQVVVTRIFPNDYQKAAAAKRFLVLPSSMTPRRMTPPSVLAKAE